MSSQFDNLLLVFNKLLVFSKYLEIGKLNDFEFDSLMMHNIFIVGLLQDHQTSHGSWNNKKTIGNKLLL